jgi:rifampicin phosphotransferase
MTATKSQDLWQPIAGGEYLGVTPSKRFPIYTRGNAGEVFPEVQYPLSFTVSWDLSKTAFVEANASSGIVTEKEFENDPSALVGCFGGYTYLNVSAMRMLAMRVPGSKIEDIDRQLLGISEAPPYVRSKGDRSIRGAMRGIRYGLKTLQSKELPQQRIDAERVAAWKQTLPNLETATDGELLSAVRSSQPFAAELFRNHLIVSFQSGIPVSELTKICSRKVGDVSLVPRLLGGAGGVASALPSEQLWKLGRMVKQSGVLTKQFDQGVSGIAKRLAGESDPSVQPFVVAFRDFLSEHGCRGPNEWETACPTWGTNPELAFALVDRMRVAADDHAPLLRHDMLAADRQAALRQANAKLSKFNRKRLRDLVACASLYAQGREQAKTTVVRAIHEARLLMRELARRCALRSGGQLDDLWFVTADELDAYLAEPMSFSNVIATRRTMRELLSAHEPPFIVNGVVPPFETWARRDAVSTTVVEVGQKLTGIPGCPGIARGRARIILDPSDPRDIGPGDVLVAPLTDPSWTPLFVPVDAIVVDVGAMLSHAVIVSRELGIPSVVSITNATKNIPEGALIEVDGTNGTVTILELPDQIATP